MSSGADDDRPELDPRVARSRRRVLGAALQLLADEGWAAFTVEKVAARAGVARSTVYRHWNDATELVSDALETLNRQPGQPNAPGGPPARPTGPAEASGAPRTEAGAEGPAPSLDDVRGAEPGIATLVEHLATALADSTVGRCLPALVEGAERDASVAAFLHGYARRRRDALRRAIERAVEAGELPPSTDSELATLALAGAVVYRRLLTDRPFPAEATAALVAQVLGTDPQAGSA